MVPKSIAEYCDAHADANCLPNYLISPPSCTVDQDCRFLKTNPQTTKFICENRKCKISLICPLGFFSWKGGCLPYATNNQKCPAGSEQCIQGLLCVDGMCMGACAEGEVLVEGECVPHGSSGCIPRDCYSTGCPDNYPHCNFDQSTNRYHCCKKNKKTGRPNRHINSYAPEKGDRYPEVRQKPQRIKITQITNIPKSRRRKIIPPPQIIRSKVFPQRAISVISTVTSAPVINYVITDPNSRCLSYAEVQVGNLCYPRLQAGSVCTFSAQCPSKTAINGQPPYLCINGICQLSILCSPGYFLFNNTCLKYSASGQTCISTVDQCLAGSTCINGECYSGCAYNQLLIENVCVGYADYGCILRSCESDGCPSQYSTCVYLRSQNAYVCCNQDIETSLLCPNTGVRPQLSFGSNIPIDCVAKQCARGYTCTHVIASGSSRYVCCPSINSLANSTSIYSSSLFNPLQGYLSVCMRHSIRKGCTPVSQQLCFCSYQRTTAAYESTLATFTTAYPNITTTTAATTTTTTTTTTVAPLVCQTCSLADVQLLPGVRPGETVLTPNGIETINGCFQLTVVCDVTAFPGNTVFMEFNGQLGGPTNGDTAFVQADLVCANGVWTYTQNGVTTTIDNVACYSTVENLDPDCNGCTADSLAFSVGPLPGDIPSIPNGVEVVNGCQQITVVCDTTGNPPDDVVFMQFNAGLGGPDVNFLTRVTATLVCQAGSWMFDIDGTPTAITSVDCFQGDLTGG